MLDLRILEIGVEVEDLDYDAFLDLLILTGHPRVDVHFEPQKRPYIQF